MYLLYSVNVYNIQCCDRNKVIFLFLSFAMEQTNESEIEKSAGVWKVATKGGSEL